MDTDELTKMAYECLRIAESTCYTLTIEFGAMSNNFKSENDYLKGILKRAKNIKRRPLEFIEYWGLEKELSRKSLISCLKNLENHIEKTLETPIQDRGLTAFSW
jgi:hypothetical protein